MGIRFYCPNGHKLNVKEFQAGRRGICPYCGVKFLIPNQSTRKSTKEERIALRALAVSFDNTQTTIEGAPTPMPGSLVQTPEEEFSQSMFPGDQTHLPAVKPDANVSPLSDFFAAHQSEGKSKADASISPLPTGSPTRAASAGVSAPDSTTAAPALLVDPITAAGNVVWYVRAPIGGQFGPATGGIIRHWLAEGRITRDTLVWREGWRDWQKAADVFPQLHFKQSLLEMTQASAPSQVAVTSEAGGESTRGNTHNLQRLMFTLLIVVVILLTGIFLWLVIHGFGSSSDNSAPLDPSRATRYTQPSSHSIKPDRPPH